MADDEVRIETLLDTSGVDKGVKDLKNKLNSAGKSIDAGTKQSKTFTAQLKDMSKTALGTAATVAGIAVAVKKTVDFMNDCEAVYRQQEKAEKSLQIAAKNNPYLNEESVYNLRNFASELQSISEVGDEVSLQIMSQLAATGRTESQIMEIMSAAADMAAVTGQDLASAAQQLNATLNGNAGALGRQIGVINNLTKEELENGKAIKIVAETYKGAAKETASTTVQLSNAWGDFKENIGRGWQTVTEPVKTFFLNVLNKINEINAKTVDLKNQTLGQSQGAYTSAQLKELIDKKQKILDDAIAKQNKSIDESTDRLKQWAEFWGMDVNDKNLPALPPVEEFSGAVAKAAENTEQLQIELEALKQEYEQVAEAEKKATEQEKAAAEAAAKAAAKQRDADAVKYISDNTKALQQQLDAWDLKKKLTGEEIDLQDKYNLYLNSYIDLVTKSNGLVSENNKAATKRLEILKQISAELDKQKAKEQGAAAAAASAEAQRTKKTEITKEQQQAAAKAADLLQQAKGDTEGSYLDQYEKRNKELNELRKEINNNEILSEQQKAAALLDIDEQYAQNKKDLYKNLSTEIGGYINETVDIANKAGELMLENVQTQSALEMQTLEEKYNKGELSEQEYYNKMKDIQRKAAQDEYKIKMFQWTASILTATANIAEGVSKAIAQGGTAGLISGALVGAAGAVQIASITAAKPIPPSFYTGGVIGGINGATYGSDNTYIHARNGEMVINAAQQRGLWAMLSGERPAAGGVNLTVNNTQANRIDANVRQQNNEIFIDILDKHINKGFTDGTYDAGYAAMNTRQEGVRIL